MTEDEIKRLRERAAEVQAAIDSGHAYAALMMMPRDVIALLEVFDAAQVVAEHFDTFLPLKTYEQDLVDALAKEKP